MIKEFLKFLIKRKKYWLVPIFLVMFLFGAILLTQGSVLTPFIYTMF